MAVGFPTKANWAAGDVLTASAQDDLAGTVNLLSNASAASGSQLVSNVAGSSFAYQATPSASNPVLNAAFAVAQRGTSVAVNNALAYSLDRWQSYYGGNLTISRQATSDTTNLPNIQYCARVQRNSGQTVTSGTNFNQSFETINSIPFAGKTVTMSFYARAGSNYSPTSNALVSSLISGTGTDQNYLSSYTGSNNVIFSSSTLTTTWQRFSYSGTVPATATELAINFANTPTGTAGTNDYYEVTGVQIDIGSVALPFRTYAATYQGELSACQRYYWRTTAATVYQIFGTGIASATTTGQATFFNPVQMRVTATSVDSPTASQLQVNDTVNISAVSAVSAPSVNSNPYITEIVFTTTGLTQYRPIRVGSNNNTTSYIGFSAEL
jgi:hypothetical protein